MHPGSKKFPPTALLHVILPSSSCNRHRRHQWLHSPPAPHTAGSSGTRQPPAARRAEERHIPGDHTRRLHAQIPEGKVEQVRASVGGAGSCERRRSEGDPSSWFPVPGTTEGDLQGARLFGPRGGSPLKDKSCPGFWIHMGKCGGSQNGVRRA